MLKKVKIYDQVRLKVCEQNNPNKPNSHYNGYIEMKKNQSTQVKIGKIFFCNNTGNKNTAILFDRYKTNTPDKTGYYYKVHNSEDIHNTALWLDKINADGVIYANRRCFNSVLSFSGNVHSWLQGPGERYRLFGCLGAFASSEAFTSARRDMGTYDQIEISKANGGLQIFGNGRHHKNGLIVTVETIRQT